jgi:signal transduction histidine kinase
MERLRFTQDLHDGPLQEIIALSFQLKSLNDHVSDDFQEQVQAIEEGLHEISNSVRNFCGELRPPTLIPFGLEKAIQSHIERFRANNPETRIELRLAPIGDALSEHVRTAFFRVYQEAMMNIQRHAQADSIEIDYFLEGDQAILIIKDNGQGFDLPDRWIKFARQGHLGLVGLVERITEIGGHLDVDTAPGKGTIIRATAPINETIEFN